MALRVDQTLTQDATGTLVMLALEAIDLHWVETELSVQYVDHNLIQEDHKNADDHLFLESACRRYGLVFCPPGTGVSHAVHMQAFGRPGKVLLGSDSHTCAGGALGMLAIGAGGLEVAMAMAGEPLHLRMPEIWGVELTGALAPWVSAKDVILEMLRRHGVSGGLGRIIECHGPGVAIPELAPLPDHMELPILLKTHDDISTDEILPAGARVLPFRSNIPEIARFAFETCDPSYPRRARPEGQPRAHAIVGGRNYGQGSSREHAALAPRYLGLRAVLALGFARIHRDNLVNFGVLPLTFVDAHDAEVLVRDDVLSLSELHRALASGPELSLTCRGEPSRTIRVRHDLSSREVVIMREGGLISWVRRFGRAAGRSGDDA